MSPIPSASKTASVKLSTVLGGPPQHRDRRPPALTIPSHRYPGWAWNPAPPSRPKPVIAVSRRPLLASSGPDLDRAGTSQLCWDWRIRSTIDIFTVDPIPVLEAHMITKVHTVS